MSEEKPRLARLTAIITQLQSKRIVTAREIAEKHGISIRTVYRDIRTLEQSGIPVFMEEGKGYSMLDGYRLPPVSFTEEEARALITAEKIIVQNKDQSLVEQYENAIVKIKSILNLDQKAKTEMISERIQVRNNPQKEKTSNYLICLQSCIANYEKVKISYLSLEDRQSEREIEPFALYSTKDNWILVAYCNKRKAFRAFRLDCIQDLQLTGEHFKPHDMTLEEYLENCRKNWNTPDTPMTL